MPKQIQCKYCKKYWNEWCWAIEDSPDEELRRDCQWYAQQTNRDRLRRMKNGELADFIHRQYIDENWLDAYVEDEDGNR